MAGKWAVIGLLLALLGGIGLWIARMRPESTEDYKELYRDAVRHNVADMEAIQRRRHEQAD